MPLKLLKRAFLQRCPHCGGAPIFERWAVPFECCAGCGYALRKKEPDTWFTVYMSTAAMSGFFLILFFWVPKEWTSAKFWIPALAGISFFVTMPLRKSFAFAVNYWMDPEMK